MRWKEEIVEKRARQIVLSEEEWVRDRIALALGGFTHFEFLYCASKLKLFTYLKKSPGASAMKISRALKIPVRSVKVLAMGCCHLGIIKCKKGGYFNSHFAELCDGAHEPNLLAQLEAHHSLIYKPMHSLLDSLVQGRNVGLQEIPPRGKGRTLYDRLSKNRKLERVFHNWMDSVGNSGLGETVLDILCPQLEGVSHLVDYGGGDGTNALRLCETLPDLQVSIFDLPSVGKMAKKKIKSAGLADRVHVVSGNFFRDPFVQPADAVMFSHITNIYSAEANLELLRKSHRALKRDGLLILFDSVGFEDGQGPASGPFLSAYFLGLATGEGMVYSMDDYDSWLKKARFKKWDKFPLSSGHVLILARK